MPDESQQPYQPPSGKPEQTWLPPGVDPLTFYMSKPLPEIPWSDLFPGAKLTELATFHIEGGILNLKKGGDYRDN